MKRLSLALAAIGFSGSIFAALPAATDPTVVNVPQLDGGFVIGVSGYYLQPSPTHGDLDYASTDNGGTPPFSAAEQDVDPGYDWGWGANIGYVFPQTGNDINLSYFQLNTSDTNNIARALPAGDLDLLGFTASVTPDIASAKAQYDLDQVDLTVGQLIDVGCRLRLHPNVGLRWASIDRQFNVSFVELSSVNVDSDADFVNFQQSSDFSGIGPLAGIDASYYLGMGFGAVAHFDSALLIGNIDVKANANETEAPEDLTAFTNFSTSSNRVVPVVDGKLGLDYTYLFNNTSNSDLTLEVGWQVSQYYNAIDKVGGDLATGGDTTPFNAISERSTSRLGLEGPYATLTLHV